MSYLVAILQVLMRLARAVNPLRPACETVDAVNYEELIRQELLRAESVDLNNLIDRVAREAMWMETARGAWITDVGFWGPTVFRREAAHAVRRMIGRSLALQCEGPLVAIPVAGVD